MLVRLYARAVPAGSPSYQILLEIMAISNENTRHWLLAILLQIGIRLRYWFGSWFGLKILLFGFSGNTSKWRPQDSPKYDMITRIGFPLLWLLIGLSRETGIGYLILMKTGLLHIINYVHRYLINRQLQQMKEQDVSTTNKSIPIPEYDWQHGSPEEFHKLFVKSTHPVILRNFMKVCHCNCKQT